MSIHSTSEVVANADTLEDIELSGRITVPTEPNNVQHEVKTNGVAHVNDIDSNGARPREELDVLVIGAGFSGCYALHKLRKLGLKVKICEAGSGYGGCWYWNRYPGVAVDSEIPLYQFSQYETYQDWYWKERFPGGAEIRDYFNHLADVWDLRKDTVFDTLVTKVWHEGGRWTSTTNSNITFTSKFVVAASGSSHKRYLPSWPGIQQYGGKIYHSASYPHEGLDVTNKAIAVIGNGASGVQILQTLAKEDCQLTAFIRQPAINLPMGQSRPSVADQKAGRGFVQALLDHCKLTGTGFPYASLPGSYHDATEQERTKAWDELLDRGGFQYLMCNYREWVLDTKVNKVVYDYWRRKTEGRVKDVAKRNIVCPVVQPYYMGTKRSNLERDYYESIDRPNVELVNLKETPIKEFTTTGITTVDGKTRNFDVVLLATGYDNVTGSLMDLNISDKHGVTLKEKWKDGVYTSLGICVPDMPNFFMMYSPQSPSQLSNGPPCIEIQGNWICEAIKKMNDQGIATIEGNAEAARTWREGIQEMHKQTLFPFTESWYTGANIPGKLVEQLVYLGGVNKYKEILDDALDGWKGFDTSQV
ncbi:Cyclopentanone 1,2-monooxygenase [Fonsecaea pedrosoi]|nr:Cyclopentanone 1,2-monooxygenase [Fonsecaea pedrosoi]